MKQNNNIETIEARGVKGGDSVRWYKRFKTVDAMKAWAERNEAQILATRAIPSYPAARA